jgi:hypothetical protein
MCMCDMKKNTQKRKKTHKKKEKNTNSAKAGSKAPVAKRGWVSTKAHS